NERGSGLLESMARQGGNTLDPVPAGGKVGKGEIPAAIRSGDPFHSIKTGIRLLGHIAETLQPALQRSQRQQSVGREFRIRALYRQMPGKPFSPPVPRSH